MGWQAFIMEMGLIDYSPEAKNTPAPLFSPSAICPAEFGKSF